LLYAVLLAAIVTVAFVANYYKKEELVLVSIFSSAISVAEDSNLRSSIRSLTTETIQIVRKSGKRRMPEETFSIMVGSKPFSFWTILSFLV
jgi:hypothetical protein